MIGVVTKADFDFIAHRFGNLCAVIAMVDDSSPQLEYTISVYEEHSEIEVVINHHGLRLTVPDKGGNVCIHERFLEEPPYNWGNWEPLLDREDCPLHRVEDILFNLSSKFCRMVGKGLAERDAKPL